MLIEIFVSGTCLNYDGAGGWSYIVTHSTEDKTEILKKVSGQEMETTSNRMELMSLINVMKFMIEAEKKNNKHYKIKVYSESAYCTNAFNRRWIKAWIVNDWNTSQGKEVANKELWNEINELDKQLDICFIKLKKDAGNIYMDKCKQMSRDAMKKVAED